MRRGGRKKVATSRVLQKVFPRSQEVQGRDGGEEVSGGALTRLHLHHLQSHQVLRHLVASLVKGKLAIRQAP